MLVAVLYAVFVCIGMELYEFECELNLRLRGCNLELLLLVLFFLPFRWECMWVVDKICVLQ